MTYAHKPVWYLCQDCGRPYDYTAEDRAQGGTLTHCPDCLTLRAEIARGDEAARTARGGTKQ